MKAILSVEPGPPNTLELSEIDAPTAGAGEVVITVEAAALNFFDTLIIEDKYQYKPARPFSPGAEVAGRVAAIGDGVTSLAPGDAVMAYTGWSGCREQVVVKAEMAVPLPAGFDMNVASGLTVTYGTTLHALRDRADLQPGETLAVLGASGGVGQAAVEIGKAMGARVIACASSADKLEFCKSLGADEVLNYREENLKERLKELTGGKGADVVYDPVGGDLAEQALRATNWKGRFLVIGFAAGDIPKIPLNLVLLKGCDVQGVFWGSFIAREPARHQANMQALVQWCEEGKVKPHVDKVFSIEDTVEALEVLANRAAKGKIVVKL
ncbi:MAG: NADPH:quinone oxidoreductase family protein [Hyphomicrobiales bacterium]